MPAFRFEFIAVGIAIGLFVGMLAVLEIGRRIGLEQVARHGPDARIGIGVVDGAVYGLFALLIGFSFSGAAARFDQRRAIVSREVNAIGTAWLRVDLLPPAPQVAIRDGFRRYLDALIASYDEPGPVGPALLEPPPVTRAQDDIWTRSVAATIDPSGERARMLLLPSLNEMFDTVEEERLARRIHPPSIIFMMLGITALAAALFAGYGVASKSTHNWFFTIGVAATISIAAYVIVELEYPRLGLIRVSDMDRALTELRATMK
ncbi:MAG: DUF4239 domain-containing protein [Gemmatimonadaceae bacterium]